MRRATVRSFAKINLDLRVLGKRPDGYHELRTVFHTISLADRIGIEFSPARRTQIAIDGNTEIPDNLIGRAARAVFDAGRFTGAVRFRLDKRIPMGAGLGGGSSNAAAVLLALPVLAGVRFELETLRRLGTELGSDVPYFLYGGAALGLGRGTELFPLPNVGRLSGLVIAPDIHVSTADAYLALDRVSVTDLTTDRFEPDTSGFQSMVWGLGVDCAGEGWTGLCVNDFEAAVFGRHPRLRSIRNKLRELGAAPALMTGSGSAVFGLYESRARALQAAARLESWQGARGGRWFVVSLISQRRYRADWMRLLKEHVIGEVWPPRSRYSR